MKKILILVLTFGIFVSLCSGQQATQIKIMSWNIWHGGLHGTETNNYEKDTANTINILKVIQQHNPDIIFMQETYCCGMEIAKQAGFKYSWRASSNLSIHSKFPIIDTIHIYKDFNSQGVKIKVVDKEIYCFNIWLHYLPDYGSNADSLQAHELIENEKATRYAEIKSILEEINLYSQNADSIPVVMGGDFNSGSHLDWIESTKKNHHRKVVEWPVSLEMEKGGFNDSYRKINPDPLVKPGLTWLWGKTHDRIDYIYYKGENLKILDSKVIKDDPLGGFFNSDHKAVLSTFKLLSN